MEFITQGWHWSVSGVMIIVVVFLLKYLGQRFGVSTSFQTLCSLSGGNKLADYFRYDWKTQDWLLLFVLGSIIGGFIASTYLADPNPIELSEATIQDLQLLGVEAPQAGSLVPEDVFSFSTLGTPKGIILFIVGGFLIGFGTRWAGGCTSGHAIAGLANLQLPSLVAVIGFFIGGLFATYFLFPIIFSL